MPIPQEALEPLLLGELEKAAPILLSHVAQHPDDHQAVLELARVYLGLQEADKAEALFAPLLEKAPQDGEALGVRGLWHELHGRLDAAKDDYALALQQAPNQGSVHFNYGRLLAQEVELSEEDARRAEEHLKQAIEFDRDHFQAMFRLALLYARTDRPEEAIAMCRDTIEINPLHVPAYLFLGEVFSQSGLVNEVIELYKVGLRINPLVHAFRDELIRLYREKGDLMAAFDTALEQSRERGAPIDFLQMGNLALMLNQPVTAEISFVKAKQLDPKDWRAHFNLGEIYRAAGHHDKAQQAYEASLQCAETAQAHTGMAALLQEQGQLQESISHFQQAFDMESHIPQRLSNLTQALQQAERSEELAAIAQRATLLFPPEEPALQALQAYLPKDDAKGS